MSNENKSIKVRTYNGDGTALATFHPDGSKGPSLRLNSPTELEYTNPPGVETGISLYITATNKLEAELNNFNEKHGAEKTKKIRSSILSDLYDIGGNPELEKYTEEANKEVAEIVQHFTTLMKSSLLEFATGYNTLHNKLIDAKINNAKRKIAKAMKTGEFDEQI